MLTVTVLCVCPILIVFGAMSDLVRYRIPNWVSLALVAAFLLAAVLAGLSLSTIGGHVLAGAIALAATIGLFAVGAFGGGDVKLFSAVAMWVGPAALGEYCLWMAFGGGALAILLLLLRQPPLVSIAASVPALNQVLTPKAGMPYGVAIAIGAFVVLPKTSLFQMVLA